MIGENMMSEMVELGRQELIAANSGQPIEAPQVEAPAVATPQIEAAPSFEMEMASYAAQPVQALDMGMDR